MLSELGLKGRVPTGRARPGGHREFWVLGEMQVWGTRATIPGRLCARNCVGPCTVSTDEGAGASQPASRMRKLRGERLWGCKWRTWVLCPDLSDLPVHLHCVLCWRTGQQ